MSPESKSSDRPPFEPAKHRQKPSKRPAAPKTASSDPKPTPQTGTATDSREIPQVVSRRMARRMAAFSGIPTLCGMLTFVVSYFLVSRGVLKLPPVAVLIVSLGWFGLGVVGLSYGVLSASWDEEQAGSLLGWEQFTVNFGRTTAAWRSGQQPK